ncbi:MAG: hypothetical protein IPJ08_04610 [Burkholderiales bacterium]|nr:hypothetical protein [Burkholderiales bacterium]
MSYAAMRSRWCLASLRAFLKRWGVYLGMAGLAFGAGATGGLAAVAAVAAWTVLPLSWVVAHTRWTVPALAQLALVLALQTAASVSLVRALRPLLWPTAWRDSEAALPLSASAVRRSDAVVSALALLLWWAVQALGMANVLLQNPAWLQSARWAAPTALLFTQALAWALGLRGLQAARGAAVGRFRRSVAGAATGAALPTATPWWWALLVLPVWRAEARTLGIWWLASLVLLMAPSLLLWWQPEWASAIYAGWSVAALSLTSRLGHLSRQSLVPLLQAAAASLPLPLATLDRARRWQLLLPALAGAALLLASALLGPQAAQFRPAVLAGWALVAALSVWWASGQPPRQADEAALRWLLSLVIQLALSTEVLS